MCLAAIIVLASVQVSWSDDKPATQPAKAPPVDFRKLKELMPAESAGVMRSSNQGERVSMGEYALSKATAEYAKSDAGEKDPRITIEISDFGPSNPMAAAMTAWQTLQIDKESDSGYERTTKVKEQPAYETYQNEGKNGQMQIFVGGRFLVNVQTTNLSPEDLKKVAESVPLDKLAELK